MAARSTTTGGKTADVTAPDADATTEAKSEARGTDEPVTEAPAAEEEKSGTAYLNVSGGPVVYDSEGHQVDNASWITTNLDKIGQNARRRGYLLPRSAL